MTSAAIFTIILISALLLLPVEAEEEAPPPSPQGCIEGLVSFSPCLSYVSAPPNNLTAMVTRQCCEAFSLLFESGASKCLCYLVQQPMILGFPLDQVKVLSLPLACTGGSKRVEHRDGSLGSLCSSASTALPPLHSSTGSEMPRPYDSGNASSSVVSLPPELDSSLPNSAVRPPPLVQPFEVSSATRQGCTSSCLALPPILNFIISACRTAIRSYLLI